MLFRNIVEKIVDGIVIVNKDGKVLYLNPAAESLLARKANNIIGESFGFPIITKEASEIDIVKKGGKLLTAEMRVVAIDWEVEKDYLLSLRDVTQRKKLYDQLKIANDKIIEQQKSVIEEERLKVLLQMSGASAHELNQSLNVLIGNIELMKLNMGNLEKTKVYMKRIQEAGFMISKVAQKIQSIQTCETPSPAKGQSFVSSLNQQIKILLIEDSENDFDKTKKILKAQKLIILSRAKTIKDAFEKTNKSNFDLILLDYILPDGNGIEFMKLMKEKRRFIPVIVITGQGNEIIASQLIQEGALGYLTKDNLKPDFLIKTIENAFEKSRLEKEIRLANKKLAQMSTHDDLTGLYNRRYFMDTIQKEVERAIRYKTNLTLCMIDIDYFKKVNDTYGHPAGDYVLCRISEILSESIRQSDILCRYGGEEFIIILPSIDAKGARILCERFRKQIDYQQFQFNSNTISLTISIGIASLDFSNHTTYNQLLSNADKALYKAKNNGRNRIEDYNK